MNVKLMPVVLTGLLLLGCVGGEAQVSRLHKNMPRSRWRTPAMLSRKEFIDQDFNRNYPLYITPTAVLLGGGFPFEGIVVDRKTGTLLWKKHVSLFGVVDQGKAQGTALGEAYVDGVQDKIFWVGLDLATGTEEWRVPVSKNAEERPSLSVLGIYGSVMATNIDGSRGNLQLRNAFTGALLDPTDPDDLQRMRQSAREFGTLYDLSPAYLTCGIIRLDPNAPHPIALVSIPNTYDGGADPVGISNGLVVIVVDEDNGAAGHSVWPKYLLCYTVAGKRLWKFPQHFLSGDVVLDSEMANSANKSGVPLRSSTIQWGLIVRPLKTVIALDDDFLYGVRLQNGRLLWKRHRGEIIDAVAYRRGAWVLTTYDSHQESKLGYVDARTGKIRWLWRLP